MLVGQDPFNRERIWQDLNHWQRGSAHQLTERALSFVEQALWDLIGRSLKMPVYKLLGGYRDTVPAYGSTMCGDDLPGGLSTPEEYAAFAEKLVARGYKAIKLHTRMPPISFAPNPKMDIKACAAVREAVGPDIDLMIDGYHWYSRAEALWIGKELENSISPGLKSRWRRIRCLPMRGWRKTCRFPSSGRRASAASTTCAPNG